MLKSIKNKLNSYQSVLSAERKESAVLVPLIYINDQLHVLFEVRAKNMRTQPLEICFPGGKVESNEHSKETAIRETMEELNLSSEHITIMKDIDPLFTPFNLVIYPYVGIIENISVRDIKPNEHEVEKVFTVPLEFLIEQEEQVYTITTNFDIPDDFPFHKIQNGKNYNWKNGTYDVVFYEYDGHIIWGITAKILRNFLRIIK